MIRFLALAVFFVAATAGILVLINNGGGTADLAAATGATVTTVPVFDVVGTLTYYPDNLGKPVPYVVYKTEGGATATKVLEFSETSTCMTSQGSFPCPLIADALPHYYGGGAVHVVGVVVAEHVVVHTLSNS